MGLFFKQKGKHKPGWLAIAFSPDGVIAVHVSRTTGNRPVVAWLSAYPAERAAHSAVLARLEKEHGSADYQCTNLLGFGDYQFLSLEAPTVPPDELKSAVRWRLKEMLDYHVDDATIDVLTVPANKEVGGRAPAMFAVAARSQLIGKRHTLFEEARITVRVIDIPEMAQRNISTLFEQDGRPVAMLSVNADGALMTVTADGELYFSRRIEVTADQLVQLNSDAVLRSYENITLEMQRSLDHFERQYAYLTLNRVVLAPAGEATAGLQAYLSGNLHLPVELLDLDAILDLSRVPELKNREVQQRCFLAIGAALRLEEKAL